MHKTSDLYKELLGDYRAGKNNVHVRTEVLYGPADYPAYYTPFAYTEQSLLEVKTSRRLFAGDEPSIGNCCSGSISVKLIEDPVNKFPLKGTKIKPSVCLTDDKRKSESISKGVFYVDTIKRKSTSGGETILHITGYDAIMYMERDYKDDLHQTKDIDIIRGIKTRLMGLGINIDLDEESLKLINRGFTIQNPWRIYSCRELLQYIGAMYGGNFIMNDVGALQFVPLTSAPVITGYLASNTGAALTVGGVRIRV